MKKFEPQIPTQIPTKPQLLEHSIDGFSEKQLGTNLPAAIITIDDQKPVNGNEMELLLWIKKLRGE